MYNDILRQKCVPHGYHGDFIIEVYLGVDCDELTGLFSNANLVKKTAVEKLKYSPFNR